MRYSIQPCRYWNVQLNMREMVQRTRQLVWRHVWPSCRSDSCKLKSSEEGWDWAGDGAGRGSWRKKVRALKVTEKVWTESERNPLARLMGARGWYAWAAVRNSPVSATRLCNRATLREKNIKQKRTKNNLRRARKTFETGISNDEQKTKKECHEQNIASWRTTRRSWGLLFQPG